MVGLWGEKAFNTTYEDSEHFPSFSREDLLVFQRDKVGEWYQSLASNWTDPMLASVVLRVDSTLFVSPHL